MERFTKTDDARKTKNWWDNNCKHKYLKVAVTKIETKSEEADDSKSVFSYLIFLFMAAPDKLQYHYTSATTGNIIPEDPTIKEIFDAPGVCMQVSDAATQSATDTIAIEIPKYQVAMLAKKGDTLVDQRGNSYFMSAMKFSNRKSCENSNDGASKNKFNGDINSTYLLSTL